MGGCLLDLMPGRVRTAGSWAVCHAKILRLRASRRSAQDDRGGCGYVTGNDSGWRGYGFASDSSEQSRQAAGPACMHPRLTAGGSGVGARATGGATTGTWRQALRECPPSDRTRVRFAWLTSLKTSRTTRLSCPRKKESPYGFATRRQRMALRTHSTITPTSAKMASHIPARPRATSPRHATFTPMENTIF